MPEKPPAFIDPDPYRNAPHRRKVALPGAAALAEMVRDGWDTQELGARFDRHPTTIVRLLIQGGFSSGTGEPIVYVPPLDDTATHGLDRPFVYPPWMNDALCAQTDPEAFFPEKGGSTADAKAVCARCPVAAECLDTALNNDERFGIWGGLSERDRRRIKKQLNQQETA